ncbi:hypothetical protein ACVIM9_001067 [Bradyrhizobium sp. USDA 4520]
MSQKLAEFIVGKRDVADAELQRHGKIHQADHQRHGYEENHDGAMRRENLVEMLRWQIALRTAGRDGLLGTHHDAVRKAAHQHEQRKDDVHDPDALVIDRGDPFAPEIRPVSIDGDPCESRNDDGADARHRAHDDGFMERNGAPIEFAQQVHRSALMDLG